VKLASVMLVLAACADTSSLHEKAKRLDDYCFLMQLTVSAARADVGAEGSAVGAAGVRMWDSAAEFDARALTPCVEPAVLTNLTPCLGDRTCVRLYSAFALSGFYSIGPSAGFPR
jgi:hypothetical protein